MTTRGPIRWVPVSLVSVVALGALIFCGSLGWWQWTRASAQGEVILSDPAVPIADLLAPATNADTAMGRDVWADGSWADAPVALVPDREVDGQEAVLVVRAFTVDADATGTGEEATLPVVVGWLAPDEVAGYMADAPVASRVDGHLRSAEGAAPTAPPGEDPPVGTMWVPGLSPAVLAQYWDSPLYSTLMNAQTPEDGLRALPIVEPERSLNFRSLTYAIEWWLFGAFFVFVGGRWIRDNGRAAPEGDTAPAQDHSQGGPRD
ncbi:SURF1 family protein [Demequina sp.]|uniref:SURF1 family protein n=1 Tax=Demequina sp. TaxID=2050685 RepID=UPI003A83DA06